MLSLWHCRRLQHCSIYFYLLLDQMYVWIFSVRLTFDHGGLLSPFLSCVTAISPFIHAMHDGRRGQFSTGSLATRLLGDYFTWSWIGRCRQCQSCAHTPTPSRFLSSFGQVARTGKGGFIPVYRDIKNGRTRIITIVKKASGDLEVRNTVLSVKSLFILAHEKWFSLDNWGRLASCRLFWRS